MSLKLLIGAVIGYAIGALLLYWAGWRARNRQEPPRGSYGLLDPPPDVAAAINRQLDRYIAAELDRRRRRRRRGTTCGGGEITRAQWEAMRTPFIEGRTQRGNGNNPTTPKPEITPRGQWPGGYQSRPSRPGANPPPSEP